MLFHASESSFPLGYLGVDVFFVVSGFVVTPLILQIFTESDSTVARLSNLKFFYKRRFYRLAPALSVMLIVSTIIILFLGPAGEHQRIARQGFATLLLVGNIGAYKYSGDYFFPNPNPLVHTWSLSVEEQIYIFLPLIMVPILRNRKNIYKIVLILFVFITAASFISFLFPGLLQPIYARSGIQLGPQFFFYSPIYRIWQFNVGGLSYLLFNQYEKYVKNFSKTSNVLFTLVLAIILFGPFHVNQKIVSILVSLITVGSIALKSLGALPNFLTNKLEWLGYRSYSIYLVHMPLLYIAKYSPVTQIINYENRIIQSTIAVVTAILLGSICYSKIENRFRIKGQEKVTGTKNKFLTLFLTLLLPVSLFFCLDRVAVLNYRVDSNLPIPSKPVPWEWDSNCQIMGSFTKVSQPCVYGDKKSEKSILLIGDSHAASNSRSIIEVALMNKMKINVFTYSSCPFILNKEELSAMFELPGLGADCINHNKEILYYINELKPTIIVISMQSTSSYVIPNNASSRAIFRNNIMSSISTLSESNSNIILIGAEPEYNSIKTWIEHILGARGSYSKIPIEDSFYWRDVSLPYFYYLNTVELFCPQNDCVNKSGLVWLFNDENHLSKAGADLLKPGLDKIIRTISN